ncbi:alkene reductase [Falsirhodobacter algicola]|uniref:Alkene reductase n=1 Tax=Falsirhodobacter algicola TaxID=2692330 RepID=A0A8J8SKP7_9RHOB|nr:alkene reductase [Falsirhodobacter algicola]QUS35578.1 alkene reductase [Falsirhodobacter algicola]
MPANLFDPITVGDLQLKNRIAMAPLTRNRANPDGDVPSDLAEEYYRQRAGAGLIITEGSQISPEGKGYAWTPGIYSEAQVTGWKRVTDAVHAAGGKIAIQLWHVGRISHEVLLDGKPPVAPSAIGANGKTFDGTNMIETSVPRALETDEIARIVEDWRTAAANAKAAGFDAVEIHAANGYLIDQFLRDTTNHRDDAYGGSIENRVRLLDEIIGAVVSVMGAGRTGIRISPWSNANNVGIDSDTAALFAKVIDVINAHGLAFLEVVEGQTGGPRDWPEGGIEALRSAYKGVYIANNGYHDRADAIAAEGDMVSFGRPYISTPDLAERLAQDAPLNPLPKDKLYGGGAEGYTDYPTLAQLD